MSLPETGLVAVVKRDCPTCGLVEPVLAALARERELVVFSQDDPDFPEAVGGGRDDRDLEASFRYGIGTVPTLLRLDAGREVARAVGWHRGEWEGASGVAGLGAGLPESRPGCGSLSTAPGVEEQLRARYGESGLRAAPIVLGRFEDPIEACFDRGWSDGLPVTPPTDARILAMLAGTTRDPGGMLGEIPPNLAPCTVEKAAIAAVMAGAKAEYFPTILAVVEAALDPAFAMHGLLCTTYFSGPVVVVSGPGARSIGMNAGLNALGQGNRANATIGRALQLLVRNMGGGLPGGIDRSVLGTPGKYTFCFAEDIGDPEWPGLGTDFGHAPHETTVTLFHGDGVIPNADQASRTPESLAASFAMVLQVVGHPKMVGTCRAVVVLGPEHYGIFRDAGWEKERIRDAIMAAAVRPGTELVAGAGGVELGIGSERAGEAVPKFLDDGLLLVRAGGRGALFSAVIGGWTAGRFGDGVRPVSRVVGT